MVGDAGDAAGTSAPPNSSAVTIRGEAFTSGGPPRGESFFSVTWPLTIMLSSDIAGHIGAAGGAGIP